MRGMAVAPPLASRLVPCSGWESPGPMTDHGTMLQTLMGMVQVATLAHVTAIGSAVAAGTIALVSISVAEVNTAAGDGGFVIEGGKQPSGN